MMANTRQISSARRTALSSTDTTFSSKQRTGSRTAQSGSSQRELRHLDRLLFTTFSLSTVNNCRLHIWHHIPLSDSSGILEALDAPNFSRRRLRDANADNLDILLRLLLVTLGILNLMHNVHALHRSPKDGVFAIKPGLFPR